MRLEQPTCVFYNDRVLGLEKKEIRAGFFARDLEISLALGDNHIHRFKAPSESIAAVVQYGPRRIRPFFNHLDNSIEPNDNSIDLACVVENLLASHGYD